MSTRPINSYPNPALGGLRLPAGTVRARPFYWFSRKWLQALMTIAWNTRVFNRHYEPTSGGVVYICNHQSFVDPMLMAFGLRRPMNFMARDTLFRNPWFSKLIRSVGTFPVRRGAADTGALKEAMRLIKAGEQVVVFAEGTRTLDGRIRSFLPGVALLAQRARATTVPVVIDGAYECWPRTSKLPTRGEIIIQYGRPYSPDESRAMKAREFVDRVRADMIEIQTDIRRRLGRPTLIYDE